MSSTRVKETVIDEAITTQPLPLRWSPQPPTQTDSDKKCCGSCCLCLQVVACVAEIFWALCPCRKSE
ncbi:Protein CBG27969 [Caenorhabditis briggsae]|uniref:Uncharacterized protein n=2 Tax=Caenorhabditis briggsae TaxID=6238 RepID=A0AAE9FCZ1_CAEBR|nr:Protein CBG27969 [Caenorhabditis briggsae]ULT83851.1 hypothetical protein L3Y34_012859 [Caenorhabditis briggsae]UMM43104.1 hypothetical protein L5515_018709 [Caenorhabditis briggsae]CAS00141.1 Protein CBG27969 [Caenorhabditis briggsae]